jgi:hypothetical protein
MLAEDRCMSWDGGCAVVASETAICLIGTNCLRRCGLTLDWVHCRESSSIFNKNWNGSKIAFGRESFRVVGRFRNCDI